MIVLLIVAIFKMWQEDKSRQETTFSSYVRTLYNENLCDIWHFIAVRRHISRFAFRQSKDLILWDYVKLYPWYFSLLNQTVDI